MEMDNSLLKKAVNGDVDAFEELIINHERFIYNIAYRMLPNTEDAKDIAQEVMIKIYKNLSKCEDIKYFKAWVTKITTNTCLDELRRRKGKLFIALDDKTESEEGELARSLKYAEKTPEQIFISKQGAIDIVNKLNKLPDESRILIILRDIQGLSYNEIAEATGTNLGTVKSRISRARSSLKSYFA